MKKIAINIFLIGLAFTWTACQEFDEPGGTATQDVAGEWWVKYYIDDGSGNLINIFGDYTKASTFNTAANTDQQLWISDLGNFWDFQVKAAYDPTAKTFSVAEGENVSYDSQVTLEDGKILLGEGLSSSGVKTDSIYFVVSFSDETDVNDDPTPYATKIIVAGHRRTGFLEDEHE